MHRSIKPIESEFFEYVGTRSRASRFYLRLEASVANLSWIQCVSTHSTVFAFSVYVYVRKNKKMATSGIRHVLWMIFVVERTTTGAHPPSPILSLFLTSTIAGTRCFKTIPTTRLHTFFNQPILQFKTQYRFLGPDAIFTPKTSILMSTIFSISKGRE